MVENALKGWIGFRTRTRGFGLPFFASPLIPAALLEAVLVSPDRPRFGIGLRMVDADASTLGWLDVPAQGQASAQVSFVPATRGLHELLERHLADVGRIQRHRFAAMLAAAQRGLLAHLARRLGYTGWHFEDDGLPCGESDERG